MGESFRTVTKHKTLASPGIRQRKKYTKKTEDAGRILRKRYKNMFTCRTNILSQRTDNFH